MQLYQLETFIQVAESGSFSAAARKLYISGSAVAQQIAALERTLGAKLFIRTTHGLTLTEVGRYLRQEGSALIQKYREISDTIQQICSEQDNCIILGTGIRQNCRTFYELWPKFTMSNEKYQVRTIDISSLHNIEGAARKPDLVESINDGELWQKDYAFLHLYRDPIVCAVPKTHPLASEKLLTFEMIRPYTLITSPPGLSEYLDAFADEANAAGVNIKRCIYGFSLYSQCAINNWLLQLPASWSHMCENFVFIPFDVDYWHDYGFFYKTPMNRPLEKFIHFVEQEYDKRS